MRRFIQLIFAFWFAISMTLAHVYISAAQTSSGYGSETDESGAYPGPHGDSHFDTSGYTPEQSKSEALTDYLKNRKLPLVGAQVLRGPGGNQMVVLYGFVGSDFGKADAAQKARRFLNDSSIEVDNRINVRPELMASNRPSSATAGNADSGYPPPASPSNPETSSSADASQYPGPENYKAQQASPYMQQFSSMMPLIGLLGMLGSGIAGGGSGFSFGSSPLGSSPYGSPYSSPYRSPYGSPYGSPFGSPYGSSPFGASPYGGSPYGGSPYGSSPYGTLPYGSGPSNPFP
jgi:hypothetical protein